MNSPARYLLASALLAFAMSPGTSGADCGKDHEQAHDGQDAAALVRPDIDGIYNFSRIEGSTGFGGATDPAAMAALKDKGFRSVVNLRLADEKGVDIAAARKAAEDAGLDYIHLPFNSSSPDPDYFRKLLAVLDADSAQPVYLHCGSATRVGALWMTKRVLEDGWTEEAAATEARQIAGKPDAAVDYAKKYIEKQQQQ
jgi:uncharacterized protein (TIGR01244 family)